MATTSMEIAGDDRGSASDQGINDITRWACLAGGGLATYAAWRSGGPSGILMGVLGGVLIYQGTTGHAPVPSRLASMNGRSRDVHLISTITIDRPASDLYEFWKGFTKLPQIMTFLESVEPHGDDLTHWVMKVPKGRTVEWDSEVTEDVPDQRIAWRSVEGSELTNWGAVRFNRAPADRGTEVHLSMHYEPPGGRIGAAVGHFLDGLSQEVIKQNLRHLKAYMESGEIPTNITTSQGRRLQ
jgi:uncharacterized membrane protein